MNLENKKCIIGESIRWHGRGGHGVVGASEYVTASACAEGVFGTNSPAFGAARSGAPILAYNRIAQDPIEDFSPPTNPTFIIIADDTLIQSESVASGATDGTLFVVNSTRSAEEIACGYTVDGKTLRGIGPYQVVVVDATGIALEEIGKNFPNMGLLGALAKFASFVAVPSLTDAMSAKFAGKERVIEVNKRTIERGFTEAGEIFDARGMDIPKAMTTPKLLISSQFLPGAVIAEAGTSLNNKTGGWRSTVRPVWHEEFCIHCLLCNYFCPDASIINVEKDDKKEMGGINYDYCKGCGVCAYACPVKPQNGLNFAITMERE